jgi:hypothetical protein
MQKVNTSPLKCIEPDCDRIPTVVLEFQHPSGMRMMGQILTCSQHKDYGMQEGNRMFLRGILYEHNYPSWLRKLHDTAIIKSINESRGGRPVERR